MMSTLNTINLFLKKL